MKRPNTGISSAVACALTLALATSPLSMAFAAGTDGTDAQATVYEEISSKHIDEALDVANNFSVFANTFSRKADMEGNVACENLINRDRADIGNSTNVTSNVSSLELDITKKSLSTDNKPLVWSEDHDVTIGVFKNGSGAPELVDTLTIPAGSSQATESVTLDGPFTENDSFKVAKLDASGNVSASHEDIVNECDVRIQGISQTTGIQASENSNYIKNLVNENDPGFQCRQESDVVTCDSRVQDVAKSQVTTITEEQFDETFNGGISSMLTGRLSESSRLMANSTTSNDVQVYNLDFREMCTAQPRIEIPYDGDINAEDADTLVINVIIPEGVTEAIPYEGCTPGGTFTIGGMNIRTNETWGAWASHVIWNYVTWSDGELVPFQGYINCNSDYTRTAAWAPAGTHLAPMATIYYGFSTAGAVIADTVYQGHQEIHKVSYQRSYEASADVELVSLYSVNAIESIPELSYAEEAADNAQAPEAEDGKDADKEGVEVEADGDENESVEDENVADESADIDENNTDEDNADDESGDAEEENSDENAGTEEDFVEPGNDSSEETKGEDVANGDVNSDDNGTESADAAAKTEEQIEAEEAAKAEESANLEEEEEKAEETKQEAEEAEEAAKAEEGADTSAESGEDETSGSDNDAEIAGQPEDLTDDAMSDATDATNAIDPTESTLEEIEIEDTENPLASGIEDASDGSQTAAETNDAPTDALPADALPVAVIATYETPAGEVEAATSLASETETVTEYVQASASAEPAAARTVGGLQQTGDETTLLFLPVALAALLGSAVAFLARRRRA